MGGKFAHAAADGVPAECGLKVDRIRDDEPRTNVAGAFVFEESRPRRRAEFVALVEPGAVRMKSPTDLQWFETVEHAFSEHEEPGTDRGKQPLVAIAAVEVAIEFVDGDRNHGGSMST